jgi:arginine exporter protein ArgO
MWDWLKAFFADGGIQHLFLVVLATLAVIAVHRYKREYPAWWECLIVVGVVFLLWSAYPAWELIFPSDDWHAFQFDQDFSTLTYGKQIWLNLWGVLIGWAAYSLGRHWLLGQH